MIEPRSSGDLVRVLEAMKEEAPAADKKSKRGGEKIVWRLSQRAYPVWKGTAVKELYPSGSRSTSQTALVQRTSRAHNRRIPGLRHPR